MYSNMDIFFKGENFSRAVHFSIAPAWVGVCRTVKYSVVMTMNRKARWETQASHINGLLFPTPERSWYNVGERNMLRGGEGGVGEVFRDKESLILKSSGGGGGSVRSEQPGDSVSETTTR